MGCCVSPRSQAELGNARPRSSASLGGCSDSGLRFWSGVGATKQSFGASRSQAELGNEEVPAFDTRRNTNPSAGALTQRRVPGFPFPTVRLGMRGASAPIERRVFFMAFAPGVWQPKIKVEARFFADRSLDRIALVLPLWAEGNRRSVFRDRDGHSPTDGFSTSPVFRRDVACRTGPKISRTTVWPRWP
jgi:hypothetical protein